MRNPGKIALYLTVVGVILFLGYYILWDAVKGYLLPVFGTAVTCTLGYLFWKSNKGEPDPVVANVHYDKVVTRNRFGRVLFLALSIFVFIITPIGIAKIILDTITAPALLNFPAYLAAVLVGITAFSKVLPAYIVDVPQVQGFVTIDKLRSLLNLPGKADVIYGPGWHISFPWEDRSDKSNFSLEVFTLSWTEEVPGKTTQLLIGGSYQFEVALDRADRFIGIDEETIKRGALDVIRGEVSQQLADKDPDDAKREIKELNTHLMETFGLTEGTPANAQVTNFEKRYGIRSIAVPVNGIDLPTKVQETRDAVDEANQVINGVAAMYGLTAVQLKEKLGAGDIRYADYNEMLDRFAAKSGNANMDIKALKIHGVDGIGSALINALGGNR